MSGLFVFPKLPPCDGEEDNERRPRRLWAEFEFFFGFVGRRLVACDLGCHAAGILSGESAMPWAIVHAQFGWVSTVELDEPTSSRTSTKQTGNIRAWFVSAGISPSSQFTVHERSFSGTVEPSARGPFVSISTSIVLLSSDICIFACPTVAPQLCGSPTRTHSLFHVDDRSVVYTRR